MATRLTRNTVAERSAKRVVEGRSMKFQWLLPADGLHHLFGVARDLHLVPDWRDLAGLVDEKVARSMPIYLRP